MAIISAAVIVIGCLCLVDLLLTFGVLRRLREQAAQLGRVGQLPSPGLPPGSRPGAFAATGRSGHALSGPDGWQIVAFFSAACPACADQVAPFVTYVHSHHLSSDAVLAVVVAEDEAPYVAELSGAAQVCVESPEGPLSAAFATTGFPAFFVLDPTGAVAAAGYDPLVLPAPAVLPGRRADDQDRLHRGVAECGIRVRTIAHPLRGLADADLGLRAEAPHPRPPGGHQHVLRDPGTVGRRLIPDACFNAQQVHLHRLITGVADVEQAGLDA